MILEQKATVEIMRMLKYKGKSERMIKHKMKINVNN
jgi:hypothetical protein